MTRRLVRFAGALLASLAVLGAAIPAEAVRKTTQVLIVGDSVASVLRWAPESMKPLWRSEYNVTLEVWGCQKLVDPGCIGLAKLSALQHIQRHRKDKIDMVIVATGYNDTGAEYLRRSIRKISKEVASQGAELMWLTYRENGNVRIKNRAFNKVVREERTAQKMSLLDWEQIARKNKHWFSGDSVHMNRFGGLQLARQIKKGLDIHYGRALPPPSTTTTTTTIAPTTTAVASS
jgi:hypothetical protein